MTVKCFPQSLRQMYSKMGIQLTAYKLEETFDICLAPLQNIGISN